MPNYTPPAHPPATNAAPTGTGPAGPGAGDLQPGAGRPLVEGPPMSVDEPIRDTTINRTAGIFGIGMLGIGLIVALILILLVVLAVCHH